VLIVLVVVIAMSPPMTMVTPMIVVVVLVIPMSFVPFPTLAVVVVVRMRPVCSFKRRVLPMSPDPFVTVTHGRPIAFDPDEACARRRPRILINDRWWRRSDIHRYLR